MTWSIYRNTHLDLTEWETEARRQTDEFITRRRNEAVAYVGVANKVVAMRRAQWPTLDCAARINDNWPGIFLTVHLDPTEAFGDLAEVYDILAGETLRLREQGYGGEKFDADPEAEDYPELRRRTFRFCANPAYLTLALFADYRSEQCRLVEVGTQPKFELVCGDSVPQQTGSAA